MTTDPDAREILALVSVRGRVVGLRRMQHEDVEAFVSYWHDGGADLAHLGIDPAKLGDRDDTRTRFDQMVTAPEDAAGEPHRRQVLGFTITLDRRTVGFVNVNVFGRDRGTPHFHLVDPSARRAGVMSAVLEAGLPRILEVVHAESRASGLVVEIRTRNVGMNAVMQRLGYAIAGTRDLDAPDGLAEPGTFNIYEIPYDG